MFCYIQIPTKSSRICKINSEVLSQPWMKGLGQSVGGMLTAAPGGGTGGDKAQGEVGHSGFFVWDDFGND